MLFYACPGSVYGSKTRIGNSNEFQRQTLRDQPVRVVLLDQRSIAAARIVERDTALKAENGVRITLAALHMPYRDTVEGNLVKTEYACNLGQKRHFLLMDIAIGLGDMKQPVENIFQKMTLALAFLTEAGQLAGIAFKARHILLGEIVKPRHMSSFFLRHREYILKGAYFVLRHDTVGFRHFGGQGDHGNRKGNPPARIGIAFKNGAHSLDNACNSVRRH